MGTVAQEPHSGYARVMESFVEPTVSIRAMPCGTRTRSLEAPCPWGTASLPASSPATPSVSEPPASTCTIYRPWCSPYSYFVCTEGATQQHWGRLSCGSATSTQEDEEPDDLSEIVCSSSSSSDEPQPPERDRLASSRASIMVRDILAASQGQPVTRHGYQCMSCCRLFPTLWMVKTHIQHSSQEGYSCKVYYRKLKALQGAGGCSSRGSGAAQPAVQPPREGTAPLLLPAPE
ncbi:spermatogenesis-associated protein 46 [Falco naumanni]|uniref:spermatogenesis-associated protein 46 n=1 Tax=Falco naumanni TaxID=148594 RepID=UPI001ADDFE68|nr:spermatogenesis-associated protein 46 [Falco naumanni]